MKCFLSAVVALCLIGTADAASDNWLRGVRLYAASPDGLYHMRLSGIQQGDERYYRMEDLVGQAELSGFVSYVHGVVDSLNRIGRICTPDGLKYDSAIRVVAKFVSDHPEKEADSELLITWAALTQAFPCKP